MDDVATHDTAGLGHNQPPDLIEVLREDHADLTARRDELLEAVERVPGTIDDDETAGKVADFIKQVGACRKNAEAKRVDTKEPHQTAGRLVDGFFKAITEPLDKAKAQLQKPLTDFQRRKADEERRRREEEARLAQEEADRKARDAALAAAAMETEADIDTAVAAEDAARNAEADAVDAEKAARAKGAELTNSRGEYGAMSSLRTSWAFDVLDIHKVPLDDIRAYLPASAVEQAIRGYVKAGGRELAGVRIYEKQTAVVR